MDPVRKIEVVAAADGVVVRPLSSHGPRCTQAAVVIPYGSAAVLPGPHAAAETDPAFEAFGIVGLFSVSPLTFLVTITHRRQVAVLHHHPVYVITGVAATPCASRQAALEAVSRTAQLLRPTDQQLQAREANPAPDTAALDSELAGSASDDDVEDSDQGVPAAVDTGLDYASGSPGSPSSLRRLMQPWLPSQPPSWLRASFRPTSLGLAAGPSPGFLPHISFPVPRSLSWKSSDDASSPALGTTSRGSIRPGTTGPTPPLLPKLLKTVQMLLGTSQSFFFSHDVDITRPLTARLGPYDHSVATLPLCLRADEAYFWNRHLLQPFLDANQFSLALPLMQGFVGQAPFDAFPFSSSAPRRFLLTVISRRSIQRAGLRCLRRGVDESGHTANTVETEQLLVTAGPDGAWPLSTLDEEATATQTRVHSFVQIRGSIPLFFSQSPNSLKPAPVLQHSDQANAHACAAHFALLRARYHQVSVVSLVEKGGVEAPLGERFQMHVSRLEPKVPFEWFDFHQVCRGLRFDRVSALVDRLRPQLDALGWTSWAADASGKVTQAQAGVLRTNCMDCLDRTNVCQSFFARYILEAQLAREGFAVAGSGSSEVWFNALWADNGDAVSKQYASTVAMKGDFTRTRKRNVRGTLNDLGLSLSRFYHGVVNDHFSQAAIDFLLGNVTSLVFDEFEADMMTRDPAVSMARVGREAIELCRRRVVVDEAEELAGGWVMLSPASFRAGPKQPKDGEVEGNGDDGDSAAPRLEGPLEQVVLLLTDAAVYVCRFDWVLDEVASFKRIGLEAVVALRYGVYVTLTISTGQTDELRNVGLLITSRKPGQPVDVTNLAGQLAAGSRDAEAGAAEGAAVGSIGGAVEWCALKAPYSRSSATTAVPGDEVDSHQSELQRVATICAEIERLAVKLVGSAKSNLVQQGAIISLEEARRRTGILQQLGHSLGHSIKKMVWAS